MMNWLFTDMDAYFASVEQYLRPELRGRPVGIIPVETDFTCVIAASYDAKRHGVKTGTGVRDARRMCPGIKLVKARPSVYVEKHHELLRSVDQIAQVEKVYSIDEWSVQLRGPQREPAAARHLAEEVKRKVLNDFGPWLSCSIGVAPTRLLAKIASGLGKPNGLTVLSADDLPGRLEHLKLTDLCGISSGMLARLQAHGVHTVRQLWETDQREATRIWGSVSGGQWWAGFHGIDLPEVATRRSSMSHGSVLAPEFRTEEGAKLILSRLICKLGQRLRRHGYVAQTLRVSLRDERGGRYGDEIGVPLVNDTATMLHQFFRLWERRRPNGQAIKKVDLVVGGLKLATEVSRPLIEEFDKLARASKAVDAINLRWGASKVYFAPMHNCRQAMENKIAFGRIPDASD